VVVVFAAAACSTTSSDSSGGPGSFSGDLPTGPSCMSACDSCAKDKCGSQASCLHSDCQDFLNCFCQCTPGDQNCRFPCEAFQTPDNHCGDCITGANACLKQNCASECPDLNPPLSSGTFGDGGSGDDGGGSGSVGDGGAAFPWVGPSCPAACGQCVESKCASSSACYRTDCADFFACTCACAPADLNCVAACPFSSGCQACVSTAQDCTNQNCSSCSGTTGTGTGTSDGGDFCGQLYTCCLMITDTLHQESCANTVLNGDPTGCQVTLLSYQADGTCH
jgi:hypothetical protein